MTSCTSNSSFFFLVIRSSVYSVKRVYSFMPSLATHNATILVSVGRSDVREQQKKHSRVITPDELMSTQRYIQRSHLAYSFLLFLHSHCVGFIVQRFNNGYPFGEHFLWKLNDGIASRFDLVKFALHVKRTTTTKATKKKRISLWTSVHASFRQTKSTTEHVFVCVSE